MAEQPPPPSFPRRPLGAKASPPQLRPQSKKSRASHRAPLRSIENSLMGRELGAADSNVLTELSLRDCFGCVSQRTFVACVFPP
jgi:hypothetical protein